MIQNLNTATSKKLFNIKGINEFLVNQRLRYKSKVNIEESTTFSKNEEYYEAVPNGHGIEEQTKRSVENLELLANNKANLNAFSNSNVKYTKNGNDLVQTNPHVAYINMDSHYNQLVDENNNNVGLEFSGQTDNEKGDIVDHEENATNSIDLKYFTPAQVLAMDVLDGNTDSKYGFNNDAVKRLQKMGPAQVLKGNTMEEYIEENAPGGRLPDWMGGGSAMGALGLGGALSQGMEIKNQFSAATGIGDTIPGMDDDRLFLTNVMLDQKKDEFQKAISLNYANTKIYNRLLNAANNAAGASSALDLSTAFAGNTDSFGDLFSNYTGNIFGDDAFNATGEEILALNMANMANMATTRGLTKPEIAIKHKPYITNTNLKSFDKFTFPEIEGGGLGGVLYNALIAGTSMSVGNFLDGKGVNVYTYETQSNDQYISSGGPATNAELVKPGDKYAVEEFMKGHPAETPRLDVNVHSTEGSTLLFQHPIKVQSRDSYGYDRYFNSRYDQALDSNTWFSVLQTQNSFEAVKNSLNYVYGTIKRKYANRDSTKLDAQYQISEGSSSTYRNLNPIERSQEEEDSISILIEKYAKLKELGYLYIKPYPNKYENINTENRDTSTSSDPFYSDYTFKPFTIPFEFSPKISEGSMQVQYQNESILNHIGPLMAYIGTNPGTVTIETEYLALTRSYKDIVNRVESYQTRQTATGNASSGSMVRTNELFKNLGVDAWQYIWDLDRIEQLEKMYRSLVMPVNSANDGKSGILKPPMIKILMQTNPDSAQTVGNLYRYPYQQNFLGTSNLDKYYLVNSRFTNSDRFKTYKTYVATDVHISYDDERHAMDVPSTFATDDIILDTGTQGNTNPLKKIIRRNARQASDLMMADNPDAYRIRGFKVTLTLVEITENYLDAIPDFASYYMNYMDYGANTEAMTRNITSFVMNQLNLTNVDATLNRFKKMADELRTAEDNATAARQAEILGQIQDRQQAYKNVADYLSKILYEDDGSGINTGINKRINNIEASLNNPNTVWPPGEKEDSEARLLQLKERQSSIMKDLNYYYEYFGEGGYNYIPKSKGNSAVGDVPSSEAIV